MKASLCAALFFLLVLQLEAAPPKKINYFRHWASTYSVEGHENYRNGFSIYGSVTPSPGKKSGYFRVDNNFSYNSSTQTGGNVTANLNWQLSTEAVYLIKPRLSVSLGFQENLGSGLTVSLGEIKKYEHRKHSLKIGAGYEYYSPKNRHYVRSAAVKTPGLKEEVTFSIYYRYERVLNQKTVLKLECDNGYHNVRANHLVSRFSIGLAHRL